MRKSHKHSDSSRSNTSTLTLGDLIAATYSMCGDKRAPKLLQFAVEGHLIKVKPTPSSI